MRIGVISDTHGRFDPKVAELFRGVAHILHAGDIGDEAIVGELRKLAPVTAVAGNVDRFPIAARYPKAQVVEIGGRTILMTHFQPSPAVMAKHLKGRRPDVIVFGHSHRPAVEWDDGILLLNPGSAGQQRFGLARTVALLDVADELRPEIVPLE